MVKIQKMKELLKNDKISDILNYISITLIFIFLFKNC